MTAYDRKKQLNELHNKRKSETIQKVDNAIKTLLKRSESIDFKSVEKESGVSRTTLYRIPEIKERISFLREQNSQNQKPGTVEKAISDSSKDALIDMLKRKIEKLSNENKELKREISELQNKNLKNIYDKL